MTKKQIETTDALQHVDSRRRGFLAKLIAGGVALPVMSTVAFAEADGQGKGKGGKAKGGKAKGAKGKGGEGKGGQGKGKGDPASMAARLIDEFDKDGDKALNVEELTAAMTAMRERRGAQGKGKGDAGKGKGGGGKGKGREGGAAGKGVKPKRPDSE